MWKTNRLASTYIQQNAHTLLHAKLNNHNKYNMDLFMSELAQTHAIICLPTTVCKTYILALGHELTHSHTTDKEVYKSMWKSTFIHGLDIHLCKILTTKTLSRGRMLLSKWRLTLALLRLSIWFFGGLRRICFAVPPSQLITLHSLHCSFTTSCSSPHCLYPPSDCSSHYSQAEEERLENQGDNFNLVYKKNTRHAKLHYSHFVYIRVLG